jgi:iron(III) transport system permease protein
MASVLYPYVYLSARASFLQQSGSTIEVARTLGRRTSEVFLTVALPQARPAIVAGLALALMECLNDIGAAEHLGVQTLTVTAYATWLQRSSLAGAAQIACIMVAMVAILFALERGMRGEGRSYDPAARFRPMGSQQLEGWRGWAALALCLAPLLMGFALPVFVLIGGTLRHWAEALEGGFWHAAGTSLMLASLAAAISVAVALVLAYARRVAPNGFTRPGVGLAGLGYALPGTVLAIGILIPLAAFDNALDAFMRAQLGFSTGLLLSGSAFAVVLAYTIRFMAISHGTVEAGLQRISPNLDAAARTLGESALMTLRRVHFPLLKPTLGAALLLVFVDSMKELPATLLLRPFGFETLATRLYGFAALERFEEAALGGLMLVLVGLVPVVLLNWAMDGTGRARDGRL